MTQVRKAGDLLLLQMALRLARKIRGNMKKPA
jgi:hypothetical protein